jgi:hypothetical protein
MLEALADFYDAASIIDILYLIITILSLIKCYKKGFVLSILSMAKWLLAYVITLIIFPRVKPYFEDIIDSEYVLDVLSKCHQVLYTFLTFHPKECHLVRKSIHAFLPRTLHFP